MAVEKMGKFSLLFDVEGDGPKTLDQALDSVKGLGDEAAKTQNKLSGMLDVMISDKVAGFASNMMDMGKSGFNLFADQFKSAIETVMPLESALQRISSATKGTAGASRAILTDFLQLASLTPFTEEQVMGLGMALVQSKVSLDAFKDSAGKALTIQDAMNEGWAKGNKELLSQNDSLKGLKLTSLTMLGDLAAMQGKTGERMNFFISAFQRTLAEGKGGSLRAMQGDISLQQKQAIFGTTGGQSKVTAQEAMNNLFKYLKEEGQIGAMSAAGATMEGLMSTLKDVPGQLYRAILGMPGTGGLYDRIKAGFADLVNKLGGYFQDPEFMGSVKTALEPIARFLLELAETAKKLGIAILEFVKHNPQITKMITGFVFFGSIVLMAVSGLVLLAGTLTGLIATFQLFGGVIMAAMGPALSIIGIFGAAIVAAIGLGYVLYKAYEENFGGIADAINGIYLVGKGLYELISSLSGVSGEMSEDTANALDKAGLLQFTIDLFALFVRVKEFIGGIALEISNQWGSVTAILQPGLDLLSVALGEFLTSLGDVMKAMGMSIQPNDLDNWREFGRIIGAVVVAGFKVLATVLTMVAAQITDIIAGLKEMKSWASTGMEFGKYALGMGSGGLLNDLVGDGNSVAEAAPVQSMPRSAMSLTTPEQMQSEATNQSVSSMSSSMASFSSQPQGGQSVTHTVADVNIDGEKVGTATLRSEQRQNYLAHGHGGGKKIFTP